MENILYNISQVLGITIIHSLWQGLLIYFLLKVILLAAGNLSSAKKYMLAVSSLMAITAWFAYTLVNQIRIYDWMAKPEGLLAMPLMLELPANLRQLNTQTIRYYYSIEKYLPYITLLYVAGLILNAVRILLARRKINTIKQTMSIDVLLQQQISRFADKLDILKNVKVGLSHMVDVPCIIGYAKPVILLPFTLSTYLAADEIEAILMHELAHIKRNDYLINLAQQVITTLLFFNPCVLLINKIIGEERENSCDDLVVGATQTPMIYAKALFKLEQNRQNELQLALAVTGKKYHLLNRIERIMKTKKQTQSIRPTLVAMLVLSLSAGSLALLNPQIAQGKISVMAIKPAIEELIIDTLPKREIEVQKVAPKTAGKRAKNKYTTVQDFKQHTYRNNVYYSGMKDPQLDKLAAEVEKHANVIGKYYDSENFKAYSDELEKRGKEIEAYYNNPKLIEFTAAQEKLGAEIEKAYGSNNAGVEGLSKQMEAAGKDIEKYFNSSDFKEMNAKLEKKYGVNSKNHQYDSRDKNYKQYQDELQSKLSPEIKKQTEQMRLLGEQMRSKFSSPDMKAQTERMRKMGDSIRKAFNNPAMKAHQEEMRKIGEKMRAYADSPEMKKQKELLKQATEKLKAYTNTPEFKKRAAEYRTTYDWDVNNEVSDKVKREVDQARKEAAKAVLEVQEVRAAPVELEIEEVKKP